MRIRATDERRELWEELKQATGESTKAGALDVAAAHYVDDLRNKRRVADEIEPRLLEKLSTEAMSITVEKSVGSDE